MKLSFRSIVVVGAIAAATVSFAAYAGSAKKCDKSLGNLHDLSAKAAECWTEYGACEAIRKFNHRHHCGGKKSRCQALDGRVKEIKKSCG